MRIQLGVFGYGELGSYVDKSVDVSTPVQKLGELKELAAVTESVGLDLFGLGEHHRREFAISAPAVVLASLAEHTRYVRLASVLTVLASDDPLRVLEQFSTLDALSNGRAELFVGRDEFPEAFTLFGHRLTDDDDLLEEKLELLLLLRGKANVTWSGRWRAALRNASVAPIPRPALPIGITTSKNRRRIGLAASSAVPLTILIGRGRWDSYVPYADLYRNSFDSRVAARPHITILVPAHLAETPERALRQAGPFYGPHLLRGHADANKVMLSGPMILGHAPAVTEQLLQLHAVLRPQRVLFEIGRNNMPIGKTIRAVEILGEQVARSVYHELPNADPT
ncbi:monooxygenase [Mycobacterium saskatchewanense]|uniref:Luciferase-like domain-containing protein n=1 Tax=Mycobacterium saskatchewanense TaxID=220927 RepID=A0AAJ3NN38_9MYCO|nr:LLM class flavin-dependent oxidoreductase [Mycobacterium saskatchewanense]ORW69100.1 hypothetical protein AWC23_20360 [Mycobacterium saskatchewanense]BBX61766.1 monooxygenase [Mycobacterium saskatchewanense]